MSLAIGSSKPTSSQKPSPNSRRSTSNNRNPLPQEDDPTWGSNFWVTLVDPKVILMFLSDDFPFNIRVQRLRPRSLLARQLAKSVGMHLLEILCM